jgi:hypothetical protein
MGVMGEDYGRLHISDRASRNKSAKWQVLDTQQDEYKLYSKAVTGSTPDSIYM